MTKHIPGPYWLAFDGEEVGSTYTLGFKDEEVARFRRKGDALLAKAGPDLYAAWLLMVECTVISEHGMIFVKNGRNADYNKAQMLGRAALAKATGQ